MISWMRKKLIKKSVPVELVTDLDAIVSKTVGFKFQGRIHEIRPLQLVEFVEAVNALAYCDQIRKQEKLTQGELLDAYEGVFTTMCPSITREMIESMHLSQIAALYNLVLECIMGKAQVEAEKKSANDSMGAAQVEHQSGQV